MTSEPPYLSPSVRHAPVRVALILLVAWCCLVGTGPALAQMAQMVQMAQAEPPELSTLFPSRAPILLDGGILDGAILGGDRATGDAAANRRRPARLVRLVRLVLPPQVLGACRSDLSDLRILDAGGREVPYLVDAGRAPDEAVRVLERRVPQILGADRSTRDPDGSTGGTPALLTESYTLAAPPSAPAGQGWDLVLVTRRPRFVRALVVTRGDDATTEVLAEGSVFRLAPVPGAGVADAPVRERVRIALPETLPRHLTVTLSGEEQSFLEPAFRYERSRRIPGGDRARVPLSTLGPNDGTSDGGATERSLPAARAGKTVIELDRPRGLVPGALVLDTATAAFNRRVEVWDEGPGASDQPLGAATLYRVPAPSWMDSPIEQRSIPIATPRGDRLRVVIEDGDSPPLDAVAVRAALRRPALVFSSSSSTGDGTAVGTLLFGGGRAFRPRYDLQALLPALTAGGAPVEGEAAEIVERLVDPAALPVAHLGAIEPNPRFDPSPALAFAHRPGAQIEARRFHYRRLLEVEPSADGLARLPLTPEDLAHARPDLADLRIVGIGEDQEDESPNQWAYLLEPGAVRDQRALPVTRRDGDEPGTSLYELTLPATPATVDRLILDSSAPFFDRPFTLRATVSQPAAGRGRSGEDTREIVLASGRLERRVGDPRPVTLAFPATRAEKLVLEIEDGSDAPLPVDRVVGRFPLPALYFPAPAGDYALLLGAPDADPPRYELTRARSLVLAVASAPAVAGPLAVNPAYSRAASLFSGHEIQRTLLWAALVIAVLVLGLFTLRLARTESAE